jgi:hypothetical protein
LTGDSTYDARSCEEYGYSYYCDQTDHSAQNQSVATAMFVIVSIFIILIIALIYTGCVQIRRENKTRSANTISGIPLQVLNHSQSQQPQQQHQQHLPPPYVPAGAVGIPINQPLTGSGSNNHRMSIESLAVHLDLPNLLNVSLADALEMDFKRLKESCGITEEEYMRLERYKASIQ